MDIKGLCDVVRETSYAIHLCHANGYGEKVYENALAHRLRKIGIKVEQQFRIPVFDEDGTLIGDFSGDLLVEDELLLELKVVKALAPEHEGQLLAYLKGCRKEHGLLINLGSYRFEIKKYRWTERPADPNPDIRWDPPTKNPPN